MATIKDIITKIQSDLEVLNNISRDLPRASKGKKNALLKQRIFIQDRLTSKIQGLKTHLSYSSIQATILVNGVKYTRTFYGLTPEDVKAVIEIEFYLQRVDYTLLEIREISTSSNWEELLE